MLFLADGAAEVPLIVAHRKPVDHRASTSGAWRWTALSTEADAPEADAPEDGGAVGRYG